MVIANMQNSPVKFFGLAVAGIPDKDKPSVTHIIATPISVSTALPDEFTFEAGAYRGTLDLSDPRSYTDCLIMMTDLLGNLVAQQKENLGEERYCPVNLVVGQSQAAPLDPNAIFMALFAQNAVQPAQTQNDETAQRLYALLASDRLYAAAYADTCMRLSQLIEECHLSWGIYGVLQGEHSAQKMEGIPPQTDADLALLRLKPAFDDGDPVAFNEIRQIAFEIGYRAGQRLNKRSSIFAPDAPNAAHKIPNMENTYPRFTFWNWHPSFRPDFHAGFKTTAIPRYRHKILKLPTDKKNPFFTDPVFYDIRAQMLHWKDPQHPAEIRDNKRARFEIASAARLTARAIHDRYARPSAALRLDGINL